MILGGPRPEGGLWAENCNDSPGIAWTAISTRARTTRAAILWVGDPGKQDYTYGQLHQEVCRFSNVLRRLGIRKGDRVAIYLPMIPELPIAMLACARVGAIHNVVFIGFSAESLSGRISGCEASLMITSDYARFGGKGWSPRENRRLGPQDVPR